MVEKGRKGGNESDVKKKPSLRDLLPKILLWGFIGLNAVTILGSAIGVYLIKVAYHRTIINEETESVEFAKDRELQNDKPVLFTFDPFTINLEGKPRKVVRATIRLELLNADGYEEAVDLVPVARDKIVRIFNAKKLEDIESIQGKLFLKDEIMTAMNTLLKKGTIKDVYFGEFVVQANN